MGPSLALLQNTIEKYLVKTRIVRHIAEVAANEPEQPTQPRRVRTRPWALTSYEPISIIQKGVRLSPTTQIRSCEKTRLPHSLLGNHAPYTAGGVYVGHGQPRR